MIRPKTALLLGAGCSGLVAAVHAAALAGGAPWYRWLGAPSLAARIERGDVVLPAILTVVLAVVFLAWALYALSGAGVLHRLPRTRTVLFVVGALYILRGLLLFADIVVAVQGKGVPARAFAFSAFALVAGVLHIVGAAPKPARRPAPRRRRGAGRS